MTESNQAEDAIEHLKVLADVFRNKMGHRNFEDMVSYINTIEQYVDKLEKQNESA